MVIIKDILSIPFIISFLVVIMIMYYIFKKSKRVTPTSDKVLNFPSRISAIILRSTKLITIIDIINSITVKCVKCLWEVNLSTNKITTNNIIPKNMNPIIFVSKNPNIPNRVIIKVFIEDSLKIFFYL